jgi:hypothetical protein
MEGMRAVAERMRAVEGTAPRTRGLGTPMQVDVPRTEVSTAAVPSSLVDTPLAAIVSRLPD